MIKRLLLLLIALFLISPVMAEEDSDVVLKFAQLTDTHVTVSRLENSRRLLKYSHDLIKDAIKQINNINDIDFVIFTGDMADSPGEGFLNQFIEIADTLKAPWYPVLGNHDVAVRSSLNKQKLAEILSSKTKGMQNGKTYYSFSPNEKSVVIVLDGTTDQRVTNNGNFDRAQIDWLKKELEANKDKVIVVAIHFPIMPPLKGSDHTILEPARTEVLNLLNQYKNVAMVISGHYHVARITQPQTIIHASGPSLVEFPNAFRIITIKKNGEVDFDFKQTNLKNLQAKSRGTGKLSADAIEKSKDGTTRLNYLKK